MLQKGPRFCVSRYVTSERLEKERRGKGKMGNQEKRGLWMPRTDSLIYK